MKPLRVLETSLYAEDLGAAEQFYAEVLGLRLVSRLDDRGIAFCCGSGVLLIFDPRRSQGSDSEVPGHGARGPSHLAFEIARGELDGWRAHLRAAGVEIEAEVDWPEGGRSLYFRDPAGNSLELAPGGLWPD